MPRLPGWRKHYTEDKSLYGGEDELPYDRLSSLTAEQGKRLWTLVDACGSQVILPGFHLVNRMGHYMSVEPVKVKDAGRAFEMWWEC